MSRSFGMSVRSSGKTDNSERGAGDKVAIRRSVLASIHQPRVFDAFAGSGVMYRHVWHDADEYVGCDMRFFRDRRSAYVADNRRVMRAIDLTRFNIFDFDAYGGPWEQVLIAIDRRPVSGGEKIGLVLTEGSRMKMTFGGIPKILAYLAGMATETVGANRDVNYVVDRAIDGMCRRWNVGIEKQWRAESRASGQARPLYIGLVLTGQP